LRSSGQINAFKWLDWTRSLECEYKPITLPFPSGLASWVNSTLPTQAEGFNLPQFSEEAVLARFEKQRQWKKKSWWRTYRKHSRRLLQVLPARLYCSAAMKGIRDRDQTRRAQAVSEALRGASSERGFLSDDRIFSERVEELYDRLQSVPSVLHKLQYPRTKWTVKFAEAR
jgi:succinoglycan biosynthesis protein ExoV